MKRLVVPEVPPMRRWAAYLMESEKAKYYSNFGPNAKALESEIESWLDIGRAAVTVNSATSGLAATLIALGVAGRRVAIPAFTFPATASAVCGAGGLPVAIDVDPASWEMDPDLLDRALGGGDFAAVVHVRPFGLCRDVGAIETVAARHELPLVIDAAAAFGGRDHAGQPVGGRGIAEVFSFHATKPFGIGEGGVVLAEAGLADRIRQVINFALPGLDPVLRFGLNGKMSEVHAAIGRAVLREFPARLERRDRQADRWMHLLGPLGARCALQPGTPPWQVFPVMLADGKAEAAREHLARGGFETRIYYAPALGSGLAGGVAPPVACRLATSMLCLPVGRHVTVTDQRAVAALLSPLLSN